MQKVMFVIITLFLVSCFSEEKPKLKFYSAGDKAISYHGRFDYNNQKSPKVWAPGAYCTFSFKGKDCEVSILDENKFFVNHNYISIIVDGGKPKRMRLDKVNNIIEVAQNLKDTVHHVLICKNTESVIGYIQFTGIRCEKLIKAEEKKKEIIEFIGDSITCGNGSDMSEISCADGKWYDQHNAYMSYGPLIAREFEMDWILSAVSGIGLTHSCCGTKYTMPEIYNRINFRPKGKKWRNKGNLPKIVCITLGQNDGLQEAERYISTYVKFVKKIKRLYPKASIVCCSSPMGEEKLQAYQAEHLPTIIQRLKNSGIQKVDFFCYKGKYRGGCLLHPTLSEHLEIAAELKAFLKDKI